jgi:hypothetical protein
MPWLGFEPTIPASERAKTVHALDCSATVTGSGLGYLWQIGCRQYDYMVGLLQKSKSCFYSSNFISSLCTKNERGGLLGKLTFPHVSPLELNEIWFLVIYIKH